MFREGAQCTRQEDQEVRQAWPDLLRSHLSQKKKGPEDRIKGCTDIDEDQDARDLEGEQGVKKGLNKMGRKVNTTLRLSTDLRRGKPIPDTLK